MVWRIAAGAAALAFGVGLYLGSAQEPTPDVPGLDSPRMQYYLANAALFSGDSDAAAEHIRAAVEAGGALEALCGGVPFTFELRDGRYAFCDPTQVGVPEPVARWQAQTWAQARQARAGGDLGEAASRLAELVAVDPYDSAARSELVACLEEQGDGAGAEVHRERLRAQREGRILAVERLRGPAL